MADGGLAWLGILVALRRRSRRTGSPTGDRQGKEGIDLILLAGSRTAKLAGMIYDHRQEREGKRRLREICRKHAQHKEANDSDLFFVLQRRSRTATLVVFLVAAALLDALDECECDVMMRTVSCLCIHVFLSYPTAPCRHPS